MEFGIENCAKLIMRSGKQHMRVRIELPNQEYIRTLAEKKKHLQILVILEAGIVKQVEMKEKIISASK